MGTLYTLDNKLVKVGSKFLGNVSEPSYPFEPIRVGDQIWMANNLNLKIGPNNTLVPVTEPSQNPWLEQVVAYDYANVYDRSQWPYVPMTDIGLQVFYSQQAAKAVADLVPGWHLPSYEEWETLSQSSSEELLPFLDTIYMLGIWNTFTSSAPNSVQTFTNPYQFESVNPKYWTTREVSGKEQQTFNTAECRSSSIALTGSSLELISDPPNEYWMNLPVRLIHD